MRKYAVIAALLLIVLVLLPQPTFSQIQIQQGRVYTQETTAPDTPASGYAICWIDATTHVPNCKNSSGLSFQSLQLDGAGNPIVSFIPVTVLPPATTGIRIYRMTAATTANRCLDGGDSGGSAVATCLSDGTHYHALVTGGTDGKLAVPVGGSANHAICWKADGITLGYCSAVVDSSGVCGTCQ